MKIKGGNLGRGEGAQKPRKWEQAEEATKWCNVCRDYTEQDRFGCVECYDPARDKIEELDEVESPTAEEDDK